MSVRTFLPSLGPRLWQLTGGSFLDTFGKGMTTPFLLIYLAEVRDLRPGVAGAVLGVFAATGLAGTLLGGALADSRGVRPVLAAGLLTTAAGSALLAFAETAAAAGVAMAVAGLGYGVARPAVSALLVEVAGRDELHMAFSATRAANNLGLGLGAAVGGLVAHVASPTTFTVLILLDAATSVLFAVVAVTIARLPATVTTEAPPADAVAAGATGRPAGTGGPAGGYRRLLRERAVLGVVLLNAALVLAGYAVFEAGLGFYANTTSGVDEQGVGLVFTINTIAVVLLQLPVARRLEGRRRLPYVAAAGLLWAGCWLVVLAAGESLEGTAALVPYALVAAAFALGECVLPLLSSLVAELAPAHVRARALGLIPTSYALGLTLGPALVGLLLELSPALLWVSAAGALVAIALAARALEGAIPAEARLTPRSATG